MKKYKKIKFFRCISIILILVLILSNTVFAKDYGSSKKNLDHIDVYVEGTISVETQINGVSQGKQTGTIIVSNISATIVDDGETRTYTNFSTQTQIGSGEMEFRKNVTRFSSSAVITISGTMVCEKLNINTTFSKTLSEDDVTAAILECPTHGGCDIRITENEVANIVTHNVVFKTEEGGKIDGDTANISYINVIDGTTFPDIPKTTPNDNYEFIGWYDESGNPVTEFPSAVKQDWVFIAKWKEIPKPTATATPEPTATATPVPTKKPDLNQTTNATVIPGNESKQQITKYVPRTGDNSNFNGYNCAILGIIISGIGISVTLLLNKKRKKSSDNKFKS